MIASARDNSGLVGNSEVSTGPVICDKRVRYTLRRGPCADLSRDFLVHSHRGAGIVLSEGNAACRLLGFYAEHFHTVEVDSAFYACPSARTVSNWAARTPGGFIFSVKVPQVITHEKVLADCDFEFEEFVKTMDILGPKLGPMVFQFPFFDRWKFPKQDSFLAVLVPFLKKLPADHKFVVEIRNKTWLDTGLADVLREHNVALALSDTSFMPRPWEFKEKFDLITADFAYVRLLVEAFRFLYEIQASIGSHHQDAKGQTHPNSTWGQFT